MVPVTLKTGHLFLVLFALPQVLAVPAAIPLGLRADPRTSYPPIPDSITDEALGTHNLLRKSAGVPPLTWNQDLWIFASLGAGACLDKPTDGVAENLAHVGSVIAAVEIWGGGGQSRALILSETIKQLGCAIHDCPDNRLVLCIYR